MINSAETSILIDPQMLSRMQKSIPRRLRLLLQDKVNAISAIKKIVGQLREIERLADPRIISTFVAAYEKLIEELEQIDANKLPPRGRVETISARLETLTNLLMLVLTGDPKKVNSVIKELGTLYAAVEQRSVSHESSAHS